MTQLSRCVPIILIILWLQACVSPQMSQELQQGRETFNAGNFKQAFHQLLPVASDGKAEAQYAVGYMYYYGYGINQDSESGLFWMNKAASQHYTPAVKALQMIQAKAIAAPAKTLQSDDEPEDDNDSDAASDDTLKDFTPVTHHFTQKVAPIKPVVGYKALQEKVSAHPHYTLQFFGSYQLEQIKALRHSQRLPQAMIWRTKYIGRDWFILTVGNYALASEASLAKKKLPAKLQELRPWVREMSHEISIKN
jgi:septal ring-binding cell division protein DamX